jgi:hypothetical protein
MKARISQAGLGLEDIYVRPTIIGLIGPKGSGKSLTAHAMEFLSTQVVRLRYAEGIKAMLRTLLKMHGYTDEEITEYLDGTRKEVVIPELGRTARYLMQTLGTEWGRELVTPNIWVAATIATAETLVAEGHAVVIDDVRPGAFRNEAQAIRDRAGVLVEVVRPGYHYSENHDSEMPHDVEPDHVIVNDGRPEDLLGPVEELLKEIGQ